MNTEPTTHRCPKCHALLPAGAPAGLCPKCLLAAAATPTEPGRPALDAPPPPLSAVAAAFPQLEILELIGQGGMGVVYKARQPRLDRLVALKLLPQALAADATFAERFNREARVLARLNHANIVTVHDFGQADGFFYLLMEYVDGVNLRQAMQAGRFTPQQAMLLVPKICEALQFAHDEGILHRDIKPENILLDARGRVKIADFGIAKLVGEAKDKITLTASGMAVGTPHYMAPEQLEHPQDVDQRADIYSLGVVFYEMLTGELPIGRFAPPSQKSPVDPRVDEVVLRALEKERERRQHNITEVRTQVEQIAATPAEGTPATPVSTAVTAPGLGRKAICYFSTPERMRNCFPGPQAHVFKCKGELRLEGEQLTFISPWQTRVVIPLREIRELSIGQFQMWTTPWVMKYERLNFLSVVFSAGGSLRTVFLTPVPPLPAPPARINAEVSGWFEAIQQAVAGLTGAAPPQLAPSAATIRAQRSWMRRASPWMFAPLAAWVVGILNMRSANGASAAAWAAIFALTLALCTGLIWFSVGFLRANYALRRGDLDAVTSDEPPDEPSWDVPSAPKQASRPARPFWWTVSAWAFLVIGVIAVIDTLAALYTRPLNPAFYPGLAHLFAGLALLTRSRIWRAVAVLALTLASAGAVFLAVAVAVAPEHGTITLPMLGLNIPVVAQPYLGAAMAVILALAFIWPWYMLLSATGRRLFARA